LGTTFADSLDPDGLGFFFEKLSCIVLRVSIPDCLGNFVREMANQGHIIPKEQKYKQSSTCSSLKK
jgi:hypothetical protein